MSETISQKITRHRKERPLKEKTYEELGVVEYSHNSEEHRDAQNQAQKLENIMAGMLYSQGVKKKQICSILGWIPNNKNFALIERISFAISGDV